MTVEGKEKRMAELTAKNIMIYDANSGFWKGAEGADYEKWLANSREIKKLQDEITEAYRERKEREIAMENARKRETVSREITTLTYKRAMAIMTKDVNNFFGRGM